MNDNAFNLIRQPFDQIPQKNPRSDLGDREFVASLATSVGNDAGSGSLESLRRSVIAMTNTKISKASFHQRMATGKLNRMLEATLKKMPIGDSGEKADREILNALGVETILLQDGSVLALPKEARFLFPGVNTDKQSAAVKIHATFDLMARSIVDHEISSGSEHDSLYFPETEELKNKLIIADLGYYDFSRFESIHQQGGYFLSRLKSNNTALICKVLSRDLKVNIGKLLNESKWEKDVVDLECRFGKKEDAHRFRVVGFWNDDEKKYHWYVTNLAVKAPVIYPLYRVRWQVELAFKALKQSLTPDRISTSVPMIIRNLILIYLLRFGLSTGLSLCIKTEKGEENTRSSMMYAKVFNHISKEVFRFLVQGTRSTLQEFLIKLSNN